MKATARANTNIALIKYWGKRDEQLFLPMNSSLSITLDQYYTVTTVEFIEELTKDMLVLNHSLADMKEQIKISAFLDIIREKAGIQLYAMIKTQNHVPTAAGFASSASGYAALAAAASRAIGLSLTNEELSRIARQGSGSACRSVFGGYVEWEKGYRADGRDSFAHQILDEKSWTLSILSVLITSRKKGVSSRDGMKRTVESSPFYQGWLATISEDLNMAKQAIKNRDLDCLGEVIEGNALKMHATMLGAKPPVFYWESGTLEVMHCIRELRQQGILVYFTIDAGPNVKVICEPDKEELVKQTLISLSGVQSVIACRPGEGVSYVSE